MTDIDPTVRPEPMPEDFDRALRPQMLAEFVGQAEARANLAVFIQSARQRGEAMDHTLFHGPPGLGKTTLAQIMARELGVGFRMTSGPVLAKAGDLAAILTNLEARDVLFIDEIHRLNPAVEEVLYPALEDFELDLVIGEGPAARHQALRPKNWLARLRLKTRNQTAIEQHIKQITINNSGGVVRPSPALAPGNVGVAVLIGLQRNITLSARSDGKDRLFAITDITRGDVQQAKFRVRRGNGN